MASFIEIIDRALYPGIRSNWDDDLLRKTILAHVQEGMVVLDLGAGAGILPQMNFRGLVGKVYGVDLDPRCVDNPMLDEGSVGDVGVLPYSDNMFDLIFANNVLEHLEDPLTVFCECARVLKCGGSFIFKTPNRFHYIPLISHLTPHSFHEFYNRLRGRDQSDTFATHYRANTRGKVTRISRDAGLVVESIRCFEGRPEYLRLTIISYLMGALYERIVNSNRVFEPFRVVLIGILLKRT